MRGIAQKHWSDYLADVVQNSDETLSVANAKLHSDVIKSGGILASVLTEEQDVGTSPVKRFPVAEWRKAVIEHSRKVELYAIDTLANTSSSSTLTLLNRVLKDLKPATYGSLAAFPLIDSNVHREAANWIRIRLLCGTTSLNESMSRITRATSQRTQTCLICGEAKEDTCHFLLRCEDPEMEAARKKHREAISAFLDDSDPLGYCGFILGCNAYQQPSGS